MAVVLKGLVLCVLLGIFIQDIRSRAVYWLWFPALVILFLAVKYLQPVPMAFDYLLINLGFVIVLLLVLTAWFSIKQKRWLNITRELLGLGDILFLVSITFYLSVINFMVFYITSLLCCLITWIIWQSASAKKSKHVPLAGLQAILLAVCMIADAWLPIDLTEDKWILNLILA